VDREEKIQLWNGAAQRVFGIGATSVVGVDFGRLPLEQSLRKALARRCRGVIQLGKPTTIHNLSYDADGIEGKFDVRLTPITREDKNVDGVMIMFGPLQAVANAPVTKRANERVDNQKAEAGKEPKSKNARRKNPRSRS
jgi:PAS domain S-box-containing protein